MTAVAPRPAATRRTRHLKFTMPFVLVHVSCLLVFFVGVSWFALAFSALVYMVRGVGITGFYHRKLSHHAFKTSRTVQFIGAWCGTMAAQGGPLWWVAHHRRHHHTSDLEGDLHSPTVHNLRTAHYGWLMEPSADPTHLDDVQDLAKYPELRWLDNNAAVPLLALAVSTWLAGILFGRVMPWTNTDGPQLMVWSFLIGTVAIWHATFAINSFCHRFGKHPHDTADASTNNWLFGILALGEGWHNNHHTFPGSARQGYSRAQVDFTHGVIRMLERLKLAGDLHPVPDRLWLGKRPQRAAWKRV